MPVTFVLTIPTVCVASSTPIVSAITASLVVTSATRPSSGSAYSSPSTFVPGVVGPALGAPPSSGSIPAGGHTMNICMLFRMRTLKIYFIIMILKELISITANLCHLSLRLRSRSRYSLLGPPLIMAVAKYRLHIFKDHLIKANPLTCKPLKGNSITGSLIHGNLEAHKDNPFRDNLRPLVVHLLPILRNLLVIRDNLTCNKVNLVSTKVILLGKLVNLTFIKANPLSSMVKHMGRLVSLKSNQVN